MLNHFSFSNIPTHLSPKDPKGQGRSTKPRHNRHNRVILEPAHHILAEQPKGQKPFSCLDDTWRCGTFHCDFHCMKAAFIQHLPQKNLRKNVTCSGCSGYPSHFSSGCDNWWSSPFLSISSVKICDSDPEPAWTYWSTASAKFCQATWLAVISPPARCQIMAPAPSISTVFHHVPSGKPPNMVKIE